MYNNVSPAYINIWISRQLLVYIDALCQNVIILFCSMYRGAEKLI